MPSEPTFSRVFADFAKQALCDVVHEALALTYVGDQVVMHVSRDSTEIVARERPAKKEKQVIVKVKRKRAQPRL